MSIPEEKSNVKPMRYLKLNMQPGIVLNIGGAEITEKTINDLSCHILDNHLIADPVVVAVVNKYLKKATKEIISYKKSELEKKLVLRSWGNICDDAVYEILNYIPLNSKTHLKFSLVNKQFKRIIGRVAELQLSKIGSMLSSSSRVLLKYKNFSDKADYFHFYKRVNNNSVYNHCAYCSYPTSSYHFYFMKKNKKYLQKKKLYCIHCVKSTCLPISKIMKKKWCVSNGYNYKAVKDVLPTCPKYQNDRSVYVRKSTLRGCINNTAKLLDGKFADLLHSKRKRRSEDKLKGSEYKKRKINT